MSESLISVIVPVYNAEKYIEKCVASIRAQTYRNLEIILVDDGSCDRSGELCEAFALEDSRIVVIRKENGGVASARNAGLDAMHGDYVGFVDADDWIDPEMYEVLLQRMIAENAQISCCGTALVTGEGKITGYFEADLNVQLTVDSTNAQMELIHGGRITNSMLDKLYAAGVFDGLRQKNVYMEDMAIQYLLIAKAERVTYTGRPMYFYYMSENSITRGHFTTRFFEWVTGTEDRLAFYREQYPAYVPEAYNQYISLCMDILLISWKMPEWKDQNQELVRRIAAPLTGNYGDDMGKVIKLKRLLVKIHPQLFIWLNPFFEKLKARQG